jgi:hypothetical protein
LLVELLLAEALLAEALLAEALLPDALLPELLLPDLFVDFGVFGVPFLELLDPPDDLRLFFCGDLN